MMSDRASARTAGILFVVASAAAIGGGLLDLAATDGTALGELKAAPVLTGALIELVLALSVVAIAVTLYPVLRRTDEGTALGYVAVRILEAVLILGAVLSVVVVTSLDPGAAGAHEVLIAAREWTYRLGTLVVFGVSAVILNGLLLRSRLVPAWLSLWGLVGGVLVVLRGVLEVYDVSMSTALLGVLVAPIGLQEMVLAGWLIVRGFAQGSARDVAAPSRLDATPPRAEAPALHR